MSTLSREHRRMLENTVAQARAIAEEGARKVLRDQYAVHHHEPWAHMTADDRKLRNQLRAHGRQLGDKRDPKRETQQIGHLVQACAYEHWHRMLFARFLAENDLLLDAEHGVAMTLDDVRELARERGRDWMDVAAELAQRMLLAVFRPDDPVLKVQLPPETRQQLEQKLASLPVEVFQADDSLGWVYQFWQRDEKNRVNKSEVKIGADELPAVTQLFTEDYMVLFLLENTLGAWWTAKRRAEGKDPALPGYTWTYLRLNEDGTPAAGTFDGWPRAARELRVLDPCMGSGHFLVFALPILARMRMEEERLSLKDALYAVLKDNLFGLEIDARCAQIAAFNLALAAWRMAGEHFPLPQLNLACSGLAINASEEDWTKLAHGDFVADQWLRRLYAMFREAPTLGSLIDPTRFLAQGQEAGLERVLPLIEEALAQETSEEARELAIAAQGVLAAFRILASRFTLVATNVPYLERGRQADLLKEHCTTFFPDAQTDLAGCMAIRCARFCVAGGAVAMVLKTELLTHQRYERYRKLLLSREKVDIIARLGPRAFEGISGEVVNVSLLISEVLVPPPGHNIRVVDLARLGGPAEKREALPREELGAIKQGDQLRNPWCRITLHASTHGTLLRDYVTYHNGVQTGDYLRFGRRFWEVGSFENVWCPEQTTVGETTDFGGTDSILLWEGGRGELYDFVVEKLGEQQVASWLRGRDAWGRTGVAISAMGELKATRYLGSLFDDNTVVLVPTDPKNLGAVWTFCSNTSYNEEVRKLVQNPKVRGPLVEVPFDLAHWQRVAAEKYPNGLPKPHSDDPTQWLFNGHPEGSDHPLQVAVARLTGYRWPRQTGSSFPDCPALGPDGLEKHADANGVVPLNAIAGAASATDRLRALLADAYGTEWSAAKLQELLGEWDSLEEWLRDGFFEEHCRLFQQRPFVWHVWDGRKDGFHALVNYHKLAAPNGEGRQTLEKLIYTYLGRWIERQTDEVRNGKEGADARFTAALHLKAELEKILEGEKPYDIFIRWKPLHEQPIGWEPDLNDGVRLNIRPWLQTTLAPVTRPKKGACVLRVTPKINYGKDRGKEPHRAKEDYPWFWSWDERADDFVGGAAFDGARWNDLHYSLGKKKEAREKQSSAAVSAARGRNR
jgi:hypothetical protein